MTTHPALRFEAPSTIQHGTPLKEMMNGRLIELVGESLQFVPGFDRSRFQQRAEQKLDELELKDRALHIAHAMAEQLPADFDQAAPLLIESLGPKLESTEGSGLAPFFYFPHSHLIAVYGIGHLESGLRANYELTQRFTAEFSIRPFLMRYRDRCLARLAEWTRDPNPHVRRLVSEGTRPRLPWAMRLPEFQHNPQLSLPLLEALKDDPELYVRRSVANHLGDLAKDHLTCVLDVCEAWLEEIRGDDDERSEQRRWLIRHALRHPAKKEDARAMRIRTLAAPAKRRKA